ncbi:LytR C-terminal domain-containing protein [Leucobacter sp. USHLN153]|uniref:LytR C-terminal domain-containing protein n=1 Tax=Leucobacter sp. USHLN153 TaxID=3081268 RepID=UPI00301649B6
MAQRDEGSTRPSTRQLYPEDRFDRVQHTGRVGAHRVTARPRYIWQYLVAGLVAFALLTTLGIFAVQSIGSTGDSRLSPSAGSEPSKPAEAEAKLDPDATVAVLNGTTTKYLAAAVDSIITKEEWGTIGFSGSAESSDVAISAVFYNDEDDAAAAAGLAEKLGGVSTYTSADYEQYDVQLVVLLGADYTGPGLDEAAKLAAEEGDSASDESAQAEADADASGEAQREVNPDTGREINPDTGRDIDPDTGWDVDAATGYPIDPATGMPTDPVTGFPIDPATGLPTDPATGLPATQ